MSFLHYVLVGDTQSCDRRRKKYESGGKKCQSKRAINASDLMQPGENKDTLPIAEILSGKNARTWVSMDFT